MSGSPNVQTVTEAQQLANVVQSLWPGYSGRMDAERTASVVEFYARYSITELVEAVRAYHREDLDSNKPNWKRVGQLLAKRRCAERQVVVRHDGADPIRRYWRQMQGQEIPGSSRRTEMPLWCREILECEEKGPYHGSAVPTAKDFEAWNEFGRLQGHYSAYCRSITIRYEEDGERRVEDTGKWPCNGESARAMLPKLWAALHKLRTFGNETHLFRGWWEALLQRDAATLGVELDEVVDESEAAVTNDCPF